MDWKGCVEGAGNNDKGRGTRTSDYCKYQDGKGNSKEINTRRFRMNENFFALPKERQEQIINAAYFGGMRAVFIMRK